MKFVVILGAFVAASSAQIVFPQSGSPNPSSNNNDDVDTQLLNALSTTLSTNRNFFPQQQESSSSCRLPDGATGTCGFLSQCEPYRPWFSSLSNTNVLQYLQARICRFEANRALVCCPRSGNKPPNLPSTNQVSQRPQQRRPVVPNSLFPTVCGQSVSDRVVGGNEISRGAFPWLAAVGTYDIGRKFVIYCGGSLITQRHVLTAAHCWDRGAKPTHVRLGEHDLTNDHDGASPQDVRIAKRAVHRSYNSAVTENDIGLITLETDVTFDSYIHPICLPFRDDLKRNRFEGNNLEIVGWGRTNENSPQTSPVPREARVRVNSLSRCQQAYSAITNVKITGQQLCAGGDGRDSCQGDSGGPLNYHDNQESRYFLAGVVSTGVGCARRDFPGVYTRVGAYVDWIVSNVR